MTAIHIPALLDWKPWKEEAAQLYTEICQANLKAAVAAGTRGLSYDPQDGNPRHAPAVRGLAMEIAFRVANNHPPVYPVDPNGPVDPQPDFQGYGFDVDIKMVNPKYGMYVNRQSVKPHWTYIFYDNAGYYVGMAIGLEFLEEGFMPDLPFAAGKNVALWPRPLP